MRIKKSLIAVPYYVWAALFIIVPLIIVCVFAFTDDNGHVTFANILKITENIDILLRSVLYAVAATAVCLVLGYAFAYFMSKQGPKTKSILMILIILPMWINFILRTQALQNILSIIQSSINSVLASMHLQGITLMFTPFAVILGLVYNYLPFMVLPIYTSLEKLDYKVIEAAQDLGAGKLSVFYRVTLPLTMPGIGSGIIMVFVPVISTFVISEKMGGGKFNLIGNIIQEQFLGTMYNPHVGAAISLVMLVLILITLVIFSFLDDETREGLI